MHILTFYFLIIVSLILLRLGRTRHLRYPCFSYDTVPCNER
jgi:hypothetical protein